MTDMTLDEAVKWLRDHVGDLRSAARELRKSPWGAKLADTAAAVDRAADKGTLAIAAIEAAREDAARYRHLFDCPEPFCYRGDVFDSKQEADAAIDQARGKEVAGGA